MDFIEIYRRWKRILENFTYRKMFLIITLIFCIILYLGPTILNWFYRRDVIERDISKENLEKQLEDLYSEADLFDANIQHVPLRAEENLFKSFVGNGLLGIVIDPTSALYIKSSRTLSLPLLYHPVITLGYDLNYDSATAVNYLSGIGYRYQCFSNGLCVKYEYYAHRRLPNILVQEIEIVNPTLQIASLEVNKIKTWEPVHTIELEPHEITHRKSMTYEVNTNVIHDRHTSNTLAFSVVSEKLPKTVEVRAKGKTQMQILTSVCYSHPINNDDEHTTREKKIIEALCIQKMKGSVN